VTFATVEVVSPDSCGNTADTGGDVKMGGVPGGGTSGLAGSRKRSASTVHWPLVGAARGKVAVRR
jgi:hypothetical protein